MIISLSPLRAKGIAMPLFKNIVVKEATDKGRTIKIVDQDKVKFTLWKTKSTGEPNPSFEAFQQCGGVGASVVIEFVEKPATFVGQDGKQVNFTDRTIYSLKLGGNPTAAPVAQAAEFKPRNFDREAYEKCCSIWAAAHLEQTGMGLVDVMSNLEKGKYWDLFQAIRKDGEKRFAQGWAKAQATFGDSEDKLTQQMRNGDLPTDDAPPIGDEDAPF